MLQQVEYFVFALERTIVQGRAEARVSEGRLLSLAAKAREVSRAGGGFELELEPGGWTFRGRAIEAHEGGADYRYELYRDGIRGLTFESDLEPPALGALIHCLIRPLPPGEDRVTAAAGRLLAGAGLRLVPRAEAVLGREGDRIRLLSSRPAAPPPAAVAAACRAGRGPAPAAAAAAFRDACRRPEDGRRFIRIALELGGARSPVLIEAFEHRLERGDVWGVRDLVLAAARARGAAAEGLREALLSPERLGALAPLLQENTEVLIPALRELVRHRPDGLVALLQRLDDRAARRAVTALAVEAGVDLVPYYRRLLGSEDEEVVALAIAELDAMDGVDATTALARGLTSPRLGVRRACLQALLGRWDAALRTPVGRALRDDSQEIRLLALKLMSSSGDRMVGGPILAVVESEGFRERDTDERRAFYQALAGMESERVTEWFERRLSAPGVLRPAVVAEQLLIIRCLGAAGGAQVRAILSRVAGRWYHPRAVRAALEEAATQQ